MALAMIGAKWRPRRSGVRARIFVGLFACALAAAMAAFGAPARAADSAVVIMYHRFGEDSIPSTNIRLEQFEAQLAELRSGRYKILPLPEIVAALRAGRALPDRTVAITIDDAYLSAYEEAWPRLKAERLPFTLFLATDPVDRGVRGYMNWNQLREMAQAGVTIGGHSVHHPHLPALEADAMRAEIEQSNRRLAKELGKAPELFSYPYGEFSLAAIEQVQRAGYTAAFGQHSGVAYAALGFYTLPRFAFNETYGEIDRFRLTINALPLPVADMTPAETMLAPAANPPAYGFTVADGLGNLAALGCFVSGQQRPVIYRMGERRIELRFAQKFPLGRTRLNCTLPGPDGRWRWFGMQFYLPHPGDARGTEDE